VPVHLPARGRHASTIGSYDPLRNASTVALARSQYPAITLGPLTSSSPVSFGLQAVPSGRTIRQCRAEAAQGAPPATSSGCDVVKGVAGASHHSLALCSPVSTPAPARDHRSQSVPSRSARLASMAMATSGRSSSMACSSAPLRISPRTPSGPAVTLAARGWPRSSESSPT
jgi:hypothetical protein